LNNVDRLCSFASGNEQHARVLHDRFIKLDRQEKLIFKDLNDLISRKDIME